MCSVLTPCVSVSRTNFPSNGPNHVPCGIRLIAHAPNALPGILDVHKEISSGVLIFLGDSGGVSGRLLFTLRCCSKTYQNIYKYLSHT